MNTDKCIVFFFQLSHPPSSNPDKPLETKQRHLFVYTASMVTCSRRGGKIRAFYINQKCTSINPTFLVHLSNHWILDSAKDLFLMSIAIDIMCYSYYYATKYAMLYYVLSSMLSQLLCSVVCYSLVNFYLPENMIS